MKHECNERAMTRLACTECGWTERERELFAALGSMLESYGMLIGEVPSQMPTLKTPIPPLAIDVIKGYFFDAKKHNAVYQRHAEDLEGAAREEA